MKILFINTGPWGTGSFTMTHCLASRYLQMGHEVKIFFPDANLESSDKEHYYNQPDLYHIWQFPIRDNQVSLPVYPLMIPDPNPRNLQGLTFKSLSQPELDLYLTTLEHELKKIIQAFKPDIIHCNHIWYPGSIIQKMGLPYVVTAHNSDQMGFKYDTRIQQSAITCAQGASRVIVISESVQQEVQSLYSLDSKKITLLPCSFDDAIFYKQPLDKAAILKKWNIPCQPDAPLINFAGKLSLTKGMDILLQANKLLPEHLNIQILVLGTGALDTICQQMKPDSFSLKNMHFLGQQPAEKVAEIHNISLFSLMPSRSEGFGIAAVEAMGCGLPIIVTACGGPEKFAVGKIIDTESPEQLAEGILEMVNLPEEDRLKLGEQSFQKSREYAASVMAEAHMDLYREILKKA